MIILETTGLLINFKMEESIQLIVIGNWTNEYIEIWKTWFDFILQTHLISVWKMPFQDNLNWRNSILQFSLKKYNIIWLLQDCHTNKMVQHVLKKISNKNMATVLWSVFFLIFTKHLMVMAAYINIYNYFTDVKNALLS